MSTYPISNPAGDVQASKRVAPGEQTNAAGLPSIIGRFLFSVIFLMSAPLHFSQTDLSYAVAAGVPFAKILVPASGLLALVGALSVLLGYHAKLGAWLLIAFLIPVTLMMHNFWAAKDPMTFQMQMAMFMKNVSILGGALLITQLGAGPWSFDAARQRRS